MADISIIEVIDRYPGTQKEFAEEFNIPLRTVNDWHRGARKCPSYVVELLAQRVLQKDKP